MWSCASKADSGCSLNQEQQKAAAEAKQERGIFSDAPRCGLGLTDTCCCRTKTWRQAGNRVMGLLQSDTLFPKSHLSQ